MSRNEFYTLALILTGYALAIQDYQQIYRRRPIPTMMLVNIISAGIFVSVQNLCIVWDLDPKDRLFIGLNVLGYLCDYTSSVTQGLAYIMRCRILLTKNKLGVTLLWLTLTIPILSGYSDIIGIFSLFHPMDVDPRSDKTMGFIMASSFASTAIFEMVLHLALAWTVTSIQKKFLQPEQVEYLPIFFPIAMTAVYAWCSIWSMLDQSVQFGPAYALWIADTISFTMVNHYSVYLLEKPTGLPLSSPNTRQKKEEFLARNQASSKRGIGYNRTTPGNAEGRPAECSIDPGNGNGPIPSSISEDE